MSRTFKHLFDVNPTFSYLFTSRETVLGKRGTRDTFFHHKDTVHVDTSFQQCETCQRYHTRKQVRGGEKNSMSKGRAKSIGMWDISNIPASNQYIYIYFNNVKLTTLASINQSAFIAFLNNTYIYTVKSR